MLDLNHGSGTSYAPPTLAGSVNAAIDQALATRNAAQPPRHYVSTSGIGRSCLRQIQYDYVAAPKDPGRDFDGGTLRIFERGHRGEDVVADWLRLAGFGLRTHRADGQQFGFSVLEGRFKGHIDGGLVSGPAEMTYPALWEHKTLGVKSFGDAVRKGVVAAKPVYAAQMALYQAYMDLPAPAVFTALNANTWALHVELVPFDAALAQAMSDRAVQVVQASEAQELLPRGANSPDHFECKWCPWIARCWGHP